MSIAQGPNQEESLQTLEQALLPLKDMDPCRDKAEAINSILSHFAKETPTGDSMMTRQSVARIIFPMVGIMEEGETTTQEHLARIGADAISGHFSDDLSVYLAPSQQSHI